MVSKHLFIEFVLFYFLKKKISVNKKIFILAENELLIEKTYEFIANKCSLYKILDFNDNAKNNLIM